jgi:hypothetical protein
MSASPSQIMRSRWFSFLIHAGLWVLLYLALTNLGGKAPVYREGAFMSSPPQTIVPVAKMDSLFSSALLLKAINTPTNCPNPFFTRYFVPPPTPVPPPPPTTRKLEVTYQGFYQTADGPKHAVLNLAGGLMVARVGALVATNVYVADANMQQVVLTNTAAQTNVLTLNTKKEIEVPIK